MSTNREISNREISNREISNLEISNLEISNLEIESQIKKLEAKNLENDIRIAELQRDIQGEKLKNVDSCLNLVEHKDKFIEKLKLIKDGNDLERA